jgi:hypothetical protein
MHLVICDSALIEVHTALVTVLEGVLVAGLLAVCSLSVFKQRSRNNFGTAKA